MEIKQPYEKFNYWFYLENGGNYLAVIKPTDENCADSTTVVGSLSSEGNFNSFSVEEMDAKTISDVKADFEMFQERPEYSLSVIQNVDVNSLTTDQAQELYEMLLVGVASIRAKDNGTENPDSVIGKIQVALNWLRSTDFYSAPASSVYHDAEVGGLLKHSLRVVQNILDICSAKKFRSSTKPAAAVLVALTHDWCKIGNYESYLKNVKNEETNTWEKVPAFRRVGEPNPIGHGALSMFYAMKFFRLSVEEAAAIRWHMGRFRCCEDEINEMQKSNEMYPLVHALQFADQLSIVKY